MEAPDVLSPEELGRLETACVVLDNEVERILNVRSARDEVSQITIKVRSLLALVGPLQTRLRAMQAEIEQLEARSPQLRERLAEQARRQAEQRRAWQAEVVQHDTAMAELTQARDALQGQFHGELNNLQRDLAARRAEKETELAALEAAAEALAEAKRQELTALEERIKQAQALLDQLIALRE
jgi:chromosome segregation ATPase